MPAVGVDRGSIRGGGLQVAQHAVGTEITARPEGDPGRPGVAAVRVCARVVEVVADRDAGHERAMVAVGGSSGVAQADDLAMRRAHGVVDVVLEEAVAEVHDRVQHPDDLALAVQPLRPDRGGARRPGLNRTRRRAVVELDLRDVVHPAHLVQAQDVLQLVPKLDDEADPSWPTERAVVEHRHLGGTELGQRSGHACGVRVREQHGLQPQAADLPAFGGAEDPVADLPRRLELGPVRHRGAHGGVRGETSESRRVESLYVGLLWQVLIQSQSVLALEASTVLSRERRAELHDDVASRLPRVGIRCPRRLSQRIEAHVADIDWKAILVLGHGHSPARVLRLRGSDLHLPEDRHPPVTVRSFGVTSAAVLQ